MTFFDQTVTPGDGKGVPPHPHDASEISGNGAFITLRVNRLLAGTITGKEIIIAGGADGILRSDGFVSGSDGWQILGDGSAEFNNVVVRGSLINLPSGTSYPGSPSDGDLFYRTDLNKTYRYDGSSWHAIDALDDANRVGTAVIATAAIQDLAVTNAKIDSLAVSKLTAGTITSEGIVITGAGGYLRSGNYAAGSAGFDIDASDGSAEFNDVTVRGAIYATSGEIDDVTVTGTLLISTGSIQTGSTSEPRLVIEATDTGSFDKPYIDWYAEFGFSVDRIVRTYAWIPGIGLRYWNVDLDPDTINTEFVQCRLDGAGVHLEVSSSSSTSYLRADSVVVDSAEIGAGTELLPSLWTTGDPNTGVYFPGADQVAFTTGGNNRILAGSADIVFYDPDGNEVYRYDDNADGGAHFWGNSAGGEVLRVREWTSTDTDIDGLISGSAFGTLLTGGASAHFTVALTDNDTGDGFQVISGGGNYSTDSTWDTLILNARSDGNFYLPPTYSVSFASGRDLYITSAGLLGYISSSEQTKNVLRSVGGDDALELIGRANPIVFQSKIDIGAGPMLGFTAEVIRGLFPEAVVGEGRDSSINYSFLTVPLFAAVARLNERIAALEGAA